MRTFIVGEAKVVGSGADCVKLTPEQYEAAKVMLSIHLSCEEMVDLMDQLREEVLPVVRDEDDWMPKKAAPSVKALVDTSDLTWQQTANLGPAYRLEAIKKLHNTDEAYWDLKAARTKVDEYIVSKLDY